MFQIKNTFLQNLRERDISLSLSLSYSFSHCHTDSLETVLELRHALIYSSIMEFLQIQVDFHGVDNLSLSLTHLLTLSESNTVVLL